MVKTLQRRQPKAPLSILWMLLLVTTTRHHRLDFEDDAWTASAA